MLIKFFAKVKATLPSIAIITNFDAFFNLQTEPEFLNSFRNEFMVQLEEPLLYLIVVTSRPQDIPEQIITRISKYLAINLPDQEERAGIFKLKSDQKPRSIIDYKDCQILAEATESFNIRDIIKIVDATQTIAMNNCLKQKKWVKIDDHSAPNGYWFASCSKGNPMILDE